MDINLCKVFEDFYNKRKPNLKIRIKNAFKTRYMEMYNTLQIESITMGHPDFNEAFQFMVCETDMFSHQKNILDKYDNALSDIRIRKFKK